MKIMLNEQFNNISKCHAIKKQETSLIGIFKNWLTT